MNGLVIALFALAAVASALSPVSVEVPIPILRQAAEGPNPDGSYSFNYESANGIQAQEVGFLKAAGTTSEAQEAQGGYTYTAPNGEVVQVNYVANENGFQAQGSHIPPIPPQILRALEYIAAHPEENDLSSNGAV